MISDEHAAYEHLDELNVAILIRHADAYAIGPGLNTNGVESFFVRLRRSAIGVHHRVCGTYLDLYAASLGWHTDTRKRRFSAKFDVLQPDTGPSRLPNGYCQTPRERLKLWFRVAAIG